jgi:hypothetical protein
MAYTTINKGSSYFNTVLYTGNGATQSVTGVGFQPDFVWMKDRTVGFDHVLQDAVRGTTKIINSNQTYAEFTNTTSITSFNVDGFSTGAYVATNNNTTPFVSWNWLGANTTASNTSGTITSTVSANTTSGFSVVSWTGNGSNSDQTLGTGLSTALDFVIAKPRDDGGGTNVWLVYVNGVTDAQNNCLLLNSSNALTTGAVQGTPARGSTAGQLKLFAGTTGNQNLNANTLRYIAYCFHSVKGFSKFGSFTGNGSADGTFVYTGFKPSWFMYKKTNTTDNWYMLDNKRNTFNPEDKYFDANTSDVEDTFTFCDFLSNGIKFRSSSANGSGDTYIYMAFAENPFVSSTQIPTTAR